MDRVRMLWFWLVVFYTIAKQTAKGNAWHLVQADCHIGNAENGRGRRRRIVARMTASGLESSVKDLE